MPEKMQNQAAIVGGYAARQKVNRRNKRQTQTSNMHMHASEPHNHTPTRTVKPADDRAVAVHAGMFKLASAKNGIDFSSRFAMLR